MDRDYIVRATAADARIRAFAATARNLLEEMREILNTRTVISAVMERLMEGGSLIGAVL